jgi:hypothetical protein
MKLTLSGMAALLVACPSSPGLLPDPVVTTSGDGGTTSGDGGTDVGLGQPSLSPGPATLSAIAADGAVLLAWAPVDGVTAFNVFRAAAPQGTSAPPADASWQSLFGQMPMDGTFPVSIDTGVVNGRTYFYKVNGVTAQPSVTGDSPVASATPTAGATACLSLPASDVTDTSLTVNGIVVVPPGGVTAVSFDLGPTPAYGASTSASSTAAPGLSRFSAAVASLAPEADQHYRVVARNAGAGCTSADAVAHTWRAPEVLAYGMSAPSALLVGSDGVYWTEAGGNLLAKVSKSMVGTAQWVLPAQAPMGLAGDDTALFTLEANGVRQIDPAQRTGTTLASVDLATAGAYGLTRDGASLYWLSGQSVLSLPVEGGTPATIVPFGAGSFDVAAGIVYTCDASAVRETPAAPGSASVPIEQGGCIIFDAGGSGLLVGDGWVYYRDPTGLHRVPASGGVPERLAAAQGYPRGVDATHVYWIDSDTGLLRKVPLAGGPVTTVAYAGLVVGPSSLAGPPIGVRGAFGMDATHVYWFRRDEWNPSTAMLVRAPKQ